MKKKKPKKTAAAGRRRGSAGASDIGIEHAIKAAERLLDVVGAVRPPIVFLQGERTTCRHLAQELRSIAAFFEMASGNGTPRG